MKTLEQIKQELAKSLLFNSWDDLLEDIKGNIELIDYQVGIIADMYACEALDAAAESAEVDETMAYSQSRTINTHTKKTFVESMSGIVKTISVNKFSILNLKNELK